MFPPRVSSLASFFLLSCLFIFGACDRTPAQPELQTGFVPGRYVRTAGGFLLSEAKLQDVYDSLTRDVALALQDPEVRSTVYERLHASPYREHKLHFRPFLTGDGQALLDGIAAVRHVVPDAVLGTLDSLVDFEFCPMCIATTRQASRGASPRTPIPGRRVGALTTG